MKVVIDTNVFVSSLSSKALFYWLIDAIIDQKIELCLTNEIILEYEEVLKRKYDLFTANNFLASLKQATNVHLIDIYFAFNLIQADPDDDKFVDCATASNADWLITNDKHFNVLKTIDFPTVNIIRIEEFEEKFAEFLK